ncbi:MAG: bifunctional diaminohydroxyphosphoribosylaminopyrimidine deaminase/5-amino-6-(5-phosphoribosylamino)uracil reductase RibD [Candidatus Aminicenantales bacterium]
MNHLTDYAYLEMAYGLAEKARGRTSPNPCVGAVIVKDGRIAGFGYHEEAGRPHAEIAALARAGRRARGAVIYLTLEPCVHWGRTPPCVDSLIGAGLRRAVVSAVDPNPLVNGRGIEALRKAGIEVSAGLLEKRDLRLNEAYRKYITRRIPFVTLKAAISLDGKIAARSADSKWISSAEARSYIHLLRGENDAVLVGSGTLLKDDPRLTVRHRLWKGKRITRVILDSRLRTPLDARILSSMKTEKVLIFTANSRPGAKSAALEARGAEIVRIAPVGAGLDLGKVLEELGKREIASLLVEGGSRVLTAFLEKGLADKVLLTLSPKLIGGETALSLFGGKGAITVDKSLQVRNARSFPVGRDWMIEGDI